MQKTDIKTKIFRIVFALFVIRVLFLILVPPYIGLANNGDFQRLMNPVGLNFAVNHWDEAHYHDSFFYWITNDIKFIEPVDNGWHQVFAVFPRIAILLSNRMMNGRFDLRFMGFTNALFYFLAVYLLLRWIRKIPNAWSYVLLALAVLVLGDSYILQYFNTFYTEIGEVTSELIMLSLLLAGFFMIKDKHPALRCMILGLITLDAVFMTLSKQQDILLVFPLICIVWILLKRFNAKIWMRIAWCAGFILLIYGLNSMNTAGGNVTAYNVISMDILADSDHPMERLEDLGFKKNDPVTEVFFENIGKNAFSGNAPWNDYADHFSRGNELKLIMHEPKIFERMTRRRAHNLFQDDTQGNYMKDSGAAEGEKTKENRLWTNIRSHIYGHGLKFYCPVILLAAILAFIGIRKKGLYRIPKDVFWIYLVLPVSNVLRFVTVLLGDSSHDDLKHFFALNCEFDIMFILNACLIVYIAGHVIAKRKKVTF